MKQGFSHTPNLNQSEEYGSAKNHNFSLSKVIYKFISEYSEYVDEILKMFKVKGYYCIAIASKALAY